MILDTNVLLVARSLVLPESVHHYLHLPNPPVPAETFITEKDSMQARPSDSNRPLSAASLIARLTIIKSCCPVTAMCFIFILRFQLDFIPRDFLSLHRPTPTTILPHSHLPHKPRLSCTSFTEPVVQWRSLYSTHVTTVRVSTAPLNDYSPRWASIRGAAGTTPIYVNPGMGCFIETNHTHR